MTIIFRGKALTVRRIAGAIRTRMMPQHKEQPQPFRSSPWLTDGSVDSLERFISDRHADERKVCALEFGAGASTVWLASRVTQLVTFEHNPEWHDKVIARLNQLEKPHRTDIRLYPRPYYHHVDALPDHHFDIILIDGRDRIECAKRAKEKLALDGILIVDNTERIGTATSPGRYFELTSILSEWKRQDFTQRGRDRTGWRSPHHWMTTIWRRP